MSKHRKWRGPIAIFVDWFMADPVLTGAVMVPLVILVLTAAYLELRDFFAGRF